MGLVERLKTLGNIKVTRRGVLEGTAVVAGMGATGYAAKRAGFLDGPRPTAQLSEIGVRVDDVDRNLQQSIAPRLRVLLENLGQLPLESDGTAVLPESNITIATSHKGTQIAINKIEMLPDNNLKSTEIAFLTKPHDTTEIGSVSVSTRVTQPGVGIISRNDTELSISPNGTRGELYIQENDTKTQLAADPTSTDPLDRPLGHQAMATFNQTLIDAMNLIDVRHSATKENVDAKVDEWQAELAAIKDNDKVTVETDVIDGIKQVRIKARVDDNISYNISYVLKDGKIYHLEASDAIHGAPYVGNEYEVYKNSNGVDWDMVRLRFEEDQGGVKGRGMAEHGASTSHSSVQRLTTTQLEAWSGRISHMIGVVADLK